MFKLKLKFLILLMYKSLTNLSKVKLEFVRNSSSIIRSRYWRCSIQKSVFKNFVILTGNRLRWSLILNKVADLQACNFIKKRLQHRCFTVSIVRFSKTPILKIEQRRIHAFEFWNSVF